MAALDTGFGWRCTSFSCQMAHQLSRHLRNALILVVSVLVALAAERIATSQPRVSTPGALDAALLADIGDFVVPIRTDTAIPQFRMPVRLDPFDSRRLDVGQSNVAPQAGVPTVPSAGGRRLTAVLIADERRVAVIDDAAVRVGGMLRDGARVAAIQPDRVFLVEKNGRWRTLTLTNRGQ
jgi:hypothetical protein